MGHIHAELMAQYAEDAKVHDEPWKLWQHGVNGTWVNCESHPSWSSNNQYRHKPRTVKTGEYEVPEPCKFPVYGQKYFVPDMDTASSTQHTWTHTHLDKHLLESNLVHLNRHAAALHAKALIEISKGWWK